jgi:hypothetical protein
MNGERTLSLREDDEELPQTEMMLATPWWKRSFSIVAPLFRLSEPRRASAFRGALQIWRNSVLDKSFAFRPKDRPKYRPA